MVDISMCKNKKCPLHLRCYRYLAEPNPHWQSYASFEYDEEKGCKNFVDVAEYSVEREFVE